MMTNNFDIMSLSYIMNFTDPLTDSPEVLAELLEKASERLRKSA